MYLHPCVMICHAVICSFLIFYFQVKFLNEQNPTNESWLSILLAQEVLQCCMIRVYNHFSPDQVGSELIHGEYNRQKFLLRCGIVQLGSGQRLTGIGYSIMLLISALTQHCSYSIVTCIAHDLEWKFPIGWLNDGCRYECLLEGIEGYEAFLVKVELGVFCQ